MSVPVKRKALPLTGLKFLKGDPIDLNEVKGKKVVVLELWATWCPPCRVSIPHLTELQKKYKKQNVVFLGVSREAEGTVKAFVNQMGDKMDYTVAIDPMRATQTWAFEFKVEGIPHAFVIDKDGNVVWEGHPMEPDMEKAIQKAAQELAGESKEASVQAPDVKGKAREEVEKLSVKEMKAVLAAHNVDCRGAIEKKDYVDLIMQHCV